MLKLTEHLTLDPVDHRAQITQPGQAHFAEGPHTCRTCTYWLPQFGGSYVYTRGTQRSPGQLKPGICAKRRRLTASAGATVTHDAQSCKYFQLSDDRPPIFEKRRR